MENSWFLFAILATLVGAVVQVVDVYLLKDGILHDPIEPTLISGFMQIMLWVVIPFVGFQLPESPWIAYLAIVGGILHISSLYYYFKAVFSFGDISLIAILWNLLLAVVPILAFFFLGEVLSIAQYFGILLLFVGVISITYSNDIKRKVFFRVGGLMFLAVIFMSISIVCLKNVYEHTSYWNGYLLYNFGIVGGAGLGYVLFLKKKTERHLKKAVGKFFYFFIFIEFLQLLGDSFSNRGTSLGPASLVTAIESTKSFFVIFVSVAVAFFIRTFFKKKELLSMAIQALQFQALPMKIVSVIIMSIGAYLVS